MDHRDILTKLDRDRRNLWTSAYQIEAGPHVTRAWSNDLSHHWIIHSALTSENADAAIAAEIAHYTRLGKSCEWKLYAHDTPADLMRRLEAQGFVIGPCEAVMVFDLGAPARWIHETDIGAVSRIERNEQIADFRAVAEEVFAKDYEFTAKELADALAEKSPQHLGYIAYAEGRPASIGRLYTHPKSAFGGLYGGGTRAAFRGRGLYRAVVAARARDAIALGCRYLVVDALPTSQPILERLGFEKVTQTWPCEWKPDQNELP